MADLAALIPFVALLALAFWKPHWWAHTATEHRRTRRGCNRPGPRTAPRCHEERSR